jgi:predicted nucleic acid-binding protein
VVDTSVLTRLGTPSVRAVIEPMLQTGQLGRTSIVDLEVGYAARSAAEWDESLAAVGILEPVATTEAHLGRSLQVQRLLAAKSQRGRKLPDLLVAATAELEGLGVLHYDADFDRIASVTGQPTTWVVPRGSVD